MTILYFNHIVKTYGTTANELLSNVFSVDELLDYRTLQPEDYMVAPRSMLSGRKLIAGHYAEWQLNYRSTDRINMTILREPWARFVSLLKHMARDNMEAHAMQYASELVELIKAGNFEGVVTLSSYWYPYYSMMASFQPYEVRRLSEIDITNMLHHALSALDRYDYVTTDLGFEPYCLALANAMGQNWKAIPKRNSAAEMSLYVRTEIDGVLFPQEPPAIFRDLFHYEYRLYEQAQNLQQRTVDRLKDMSEGRLYNQLSPNPCAWQHWEKPINAYGLSNRELPELKHYLGRWARLMVSPQCGFEVVGEVSNPEFIEIIIWSSPWWSINAFSLSVNGRTVRLRREDATFYARQDDMHTIYIKVPLEGAEKQMNRWQIDLSVPSDSMPAIFWICDVSVVGSDNRFPMPVSTENRIEIASILPEKVLPVSDEATLSLAGSTVTQEPEGEDRQQLTDVGLELLSVISEEEKSPVDTVALLEKSVLEAIESKSKKAQPSSITTTSTAKIPSGDEKPRSVTKATPKEEPEK